jgi:hypothetical protein
MSAQWQKLIEERPPDSFIYSIMTADVFTNDLHATVQIENCCSVYSAGAHETTLLSLKPCREGKQGLDGEAGFRRGDRREILPNRIDAGLAANSAARRYGSEPLHRIKLSSDTHSQIDHHRILRGRRNSADL